MTININGKEHEIRFGIRFVNELDKAFAGDQAQYGGGITYALPRLLDGDVAALAKVLYLGTCTEKGRPKEDDVNAYVEDHEDVEALMAEVLDELKKQNATKLKTVKLLQIFEDIEKAKQAD